MILFARPMCETLGAGPRREGKREDDKKEDYWILKSILTEDGIAAFLAQHAKPSQIKGRLGSSKFMLKPVGSVARKD